ncbi:MAG TPA: endonuclease [Edaphocola sp.]|nr:endonuclease [Edaphocola sp.]
MLRIIFLHIIYVFIFGITINAQAPLYYYQGTSNDSGFTLKKKLHTIISNQSISWNYSDIPEFYKQTDRDLYYEQDSSLLDIYSENPTGADPYNYYYENNSLIAGASSEGEGWNREHIYSQSFFYNNYPMYSDLHALVPADARVNQRRSNYPFGKVDIPTFTSLNGTKVGPSNMLGFTNTVTEPIDEFKGDVARMLLYMAVRYENLLPWFNYTNVRNPLDSLSEKAFKDWSLNILLQWHQQDPVSQKEMDRNNIIFTIQGNRNPFIDHPEFANAIWTNLPSNNSIPDAPYRIDIDKKGAHFIVISWPPVPDIDLLGYEVFLNNENVGTTTMNTYVLDHLDTNSNYNIKVRSYSTSYIFSPFTQLNTTTLNSDTFSSELFISKVIVGTEFNKAIELTNNTGHTVDLRNYYLNIRQQNLSSGNLYWSSNKIQLEGTLEHHDKLVILNPLANLNCIDNNKANILSNATPLQLDGNFAIELSYKDNKRIDLLGNPYSIGDYAVEKSLYRKEEIKEPQSIFDITEWDLYPVNYCESLGDTVNNNTGNNSITVPLKKLSIYPNPNKEGIWYVNGADLEKIKELKVLNLTGKILSVQQYPFKNGNNRISIPNIHSGWFFICFDNKCYPVLIP